MVKNFYLAILFFISSFALAQVPQGVNYQGVARDSYGAAISNTVIAIQFKIHQGSPSGTLVFSENHPSVQTDTFGLYSVVIGSVSSLSSVNWSLGSMYIEVDINGSIIATTQLQSVPYALYAASSGNSGNNINSVSSANTNNIVTSTSSNSVTVDLAIVGTTTTVGSSNAIPQITVDQYGRVISTTQLSITGLIPSGASNGQVLGYNGSAPTWTTLPAQTTYSAGTGIDITGGVISNTATAVTLSGTGATTILGSYPNYTVNTPAQTTYTAGTGIDITGGVISNTATVNISGAGTATVTGTYPSYTVNTPASITYSAGTGIDITGGVISNTATSSLPTPTVGSLLYSNTSNSWTPTNPSNISSDGNSISVTDAITGTAATFSSSATSGGNPVLQVVSNCSNGYGIKVDANSGPAIVANSNGPYAINGNIRSGSGNAMEGDILNGANGNAVAGYIDNNNSTGSAGYFENTGTTNTSAVLKVVNISGNAGHSAEFSGGKGVVADSLTATNLTIGNNLHVSLNPGTGKVLTSDAFGNATWQTPASGGLSPSLTNGYVFVGNTSNLATGVAMSGDASISNTGALTLANSGVTAGTYPKVTVDSKGRVTSGTAQIATADIGAGAVNLTSQVSGVLPTANGGMGANMTAGAIGAIPYATSTTTYGTLAAGTAGQVLVSNGAGTAPTWTTLAAASVTGATNGLSLTTGSVSLGGTLTGNTTINQGANNMTYNATTGNFQVSNSSGSTNAFGVTTAGTGSAGTFSITNVSNTAAALVVGTSGSGPAIIGTSGAGTGPAIYSNGPLKLGGVVLDGMASAGNPGDVLVSQGTSTPKWGPPNTAFWSLSGNALGGSGYFLGTTDAFPMVIATTNTTTAQPIIFQTNGHVERMRIDATGNVGIGTNAPNNAIQVYGLINFNDGLTSTSLGSTAGIANTGNNNTFIGYAAGTSNTSGARVTYVGYKAGTAATGNYNAFFGAQAGLNTTSSTDNTFIGYNAGVANINGYSNTYVGSKAGGNEKGNGNVFVGDSAGYNYTTGSQNVIIGYKAGTTNVSNAAGNNTLIGAGADVSATGLSNVVAIGTNAIVNNNNTAQIGGTGSYSMDVSFAGALTPNGNAGSSGQFLVSQGSGAAPMWISQQPVNFSAYSTSSSQTITPGNTTQTVNFPTVSYNNGGGSMAGGVYTATVTGVYHFDAAVSIATSFSTPAYIRLYVNGSEVREVQYATIAQTPSSMVISGDAMVPAGQTAEIRIFSTSTSLQVAGVAAGTTVWFSGHLIR